MKDQVASFIIEAKDIPSIQVNDKGKIDSDEHQHLYPGQYQIVFMSPETFFKGTELRKLICMKTYRKFGGICYVIDEAHFCSKLYVAIMFFQGVAIHLFTLANSLFGIHCY